MNVTALRRSSVAAFLALAAVAVAPDSEADPAPLQPAPPRGPVRIEAFQKPTVIGIPTPYAGGAVDVELVLTNTTKTPQNDVVVTIEYGRDGKLSQTVNVPAQGKAKVKFTDPVGLTGACAPRSYGIVARTTDGQQDSRHGVITPTCTVSSKLVDPWNLAEPDRVEERQKDAVFFDNAVLESASCAEGLKIKGRMSNRSKLSSPSLLVQAKGGTTVVAQTTAAFPLGAGEYKTVELTPVANGRREIPDTVDVAIVDWTHGLGSHLVNQGIQVKTTKSCSLAYGFGDVLATAVAPLR